MSIRPLRKPVVARPALASAKHGHLFWIKWLLLKRMPTAITVLIATLVQSRDSARSG